LSPSGNTTKGRWLLLIVWIALIFSFSTDSFSSSKTSTIIVPVLKFLFPFLSAQQLEVGHIVCRKAGHLSEYFVLGVLAWRALRVDSRDVARVWLLSAALVLVVALADEFHQSFVPSRTSSLMDVGYDFIGGIAALGVLSKFRHENRPLYSHSVL
jgi:VanZ family protein